MGGYRQEGIVLNVQTPSQGFQWNFNPPSIEEYHRLARVKVCPVTVFHSIGKMVDHGEILSLVARQENMVKEYGKDTVLEQLSKIENHDGLWFTQYFNQIVAAVDVQSE